jgi:hypothetical protein
MFAKPINPFLLRLRAACLVLCIYLTVAQQALADQEAAPCSQDAANDALLLPEVACMSDEELHTFRGGFIRDNQIVIGFGFERIVRVDGEVQEHILAGIPSLNLTSNIQLVPISRSLDAGGSRFTLEDAGSGSIISEGSISGLSPPMQLVPSTSALQDMMNNVIQNSLDDKVIDQVRVLNIDLIGLGASSSFDPQTNFNSTLFESLGL